MAPLNILIIGAGISDCTTARALRKHYDVTIVERFRDDLEGGLEISAAINMGPTATQFPDAIGLNRMETRPIVIKTPRTFTKNPERNEHN